LFSSGRGSFRLGIDARHTARRHRELDARYRIHRHTQAAAKTNARGRTLGNLVVMALTVLAIGMAAYALRVESHHQQQWERIR